MFDIRYSKYAVNFLKSTKKKQETLKENPIEFGNI